MPGQGRGPGQGVSVTDQPVQPKNLLVSGTCLVKGATYYYGQVNIRRGGRLIFVEPAASSALKGQDFWANAIIIEAGGEMLAGVPVAVLMRRKDVSGKVYGTNGKTLTIHLYGGEKADKTGASCVTLPPDKRAEYDKQKYGEQDPNVEECGILSFSGTPMAINCGTVLTTNRLCLVASRTASTNTPNCMAITASSSRPAAWDTSATRCWHCRMTEH